MILIVVENDMERNLSAVYVKVLYFVWSKCVLTAITLLARRVNRDILIFKMTHETHCQRFEFSCFQTPQFSFINL